MFKPLIKKYGFRIRTRHGSILDSLLIFGADELEAEHKLRQVYYGCEILEARRLTIQSQENDALSYEALVDLLVKSPK
ncbi:MAG: hypothetical protein V4623_09890 [Pseudomonadota bacterium]